MSGEDVIGPPQPPPPPPDEQAAPHEWAAVGHVVDEHGQVWVVQSCSCGLARQVNAPRVTAP